MNHGPKISRRRSDAFVLAIAVLILCFGWPFYRLVRFALHDDLYSHILLIPFISGYLIWIKRDSRPPRAQPNRSFALLFSALGVTALGSYVAFRIVGVALAEPDFLALMMFCFLSFLAAVCAWFLGKQTLRSIALPLGMLLFLAPFPTAIRSWMETGLQYSSAATAVAFFKVSGTPMFNHGLILELSDITLQVAPQCSGIHSTLALFITSLLAGQLFLRSNWRRSALALAVIPLAILRNGFRVFTLGELCVHLGPQMIDSPIHHQGGPLFFILSLVPFLFFMFLLTKGERQQFRVPAVAPSP